VHRPAKQTIKPPWTLAPIAGAILFIFLYLIAAHFYPGGSQLDTSSPGFSWTQNYWCNLLSETAINGKLNSARPFAVAAMLVLMLTLGLFWYLFPLQTPFSIGKRRVVQLSGALSMATGAFLSSSYHDTVVNVASAFGLVALAGTLVGLKELRWTRLLYFGFFNLLLVLVNNILYYGNGLRLYLPVVQKCTFLLFLLWVALICMRMYTTKQREKTAANIALPQAGLKNKG